MATWKVSQPLVHFRTETIVEALFHMGQRLHMPRILIVALTSKEVDVIEEWLLDVISLLHEETRRWDHIYPYYRRIRWEADILNFPRSNIFHVRLEMRLPMEMIDRYAKGFTLWTLGLVFRTFPNKDHHHRHRIVLQFDTVIIDESYQKVDSEFFILFDHINPCLPD